MKIFQKLSHLFKPKSGPEYGAPYIVKTLKCIGEAKFPSALFRQPQSLTFNKSKSMLNSNVLGFAGMHTFQNKAEALQYAISFTAINADGGLKADYEAAQELFDFICKNVKLPETKSESLDGFIERSTTLMESLQKKVEAKELHPEDNLEECNEYIAAPKECAEPEGDPYLGRLRKIRRHLVENYEIAQTYDITLNLGAETNIKGIGKTNHLLFNGPNLLPALHMFIDTLEQHYNEAIERKAIKA